MEDKKRCKFDIVAFLAVLILIAFIGCMCVAVAFGIKDNKLINNVAYADVVSVPYSPNLVSDTVYNISFSLSGQTQIVGTPYDFNLFSGSGSGASCVGSSSGIRLSQSGTAYVPSGFGIVYPMTEGRFYTCTFHITSYTGSPFIYVSYNINSFFTKASVQISSIGDVSLTFEAGVVGFDSNITNCVWISCSTGFDVSFDKIKLEEGSFFTGWSEEEYNQNPIYDPKYSQGYEAGYNVGYNVGYNAGFDAGLNSFAGRTNYQLIGNLGRVNYSSLQDNPLLDLDFVFQNQHYTLLNSQNTSVQYLDGNTYSFDYPEGQWNLDYLPGVKVVSNLLYGNILISCPYWIGGSMFWQIAFEDTITGAVVYTDYRDTLHYKFVPSYTFQENNQATTSGYPELDSWNFFDIEYFFENPQNIYFIPSRAIYNWDLSSGDIVKYPTNEFFNIYSTQSQTALTSFDDGYQKGVEAGREGAVSENAQAVSNARAAGYEEGRRDALADGNDYTFMGLLGAVFDAPIKSFQGLLNFDVLGVNMQSFVLALLSLSVIIIIIKIALGGK